MSWFSSAFSAIGQAANWSFNNVVKPVASFVKPIAQATLSAIPVVGPVASALVGKLLPDAPQPVQDQAAQAVAEVAAAPVPATPEQAQAQASAAKQQLIAVGVDPAQASTVGALVHTVAQAKPSQALAVLNETHEKLPNAPLQQGLTKDDVKTVLNGALEGAKNGAVDTYLDKTNDGQATKQAAIDSQGSKILPYVLGGLLLFIFFRRTK